MYHYLSFPPADADIYRLDLSVTPPLFDQHLAAIYNAGYTTIDFYDLLNFLNDGKPLPEKAVLLTFDDGYRDNYYNALPLLQKWGMRATLFIVTDFIDQQLPAYITWDMAREMETAGMTMEAHGRNHFSLENRDVDFLVWQALSHERIEAEIGRRPRIISYPAGDYDQRTIEVFGNSGYWAGVTTIPGAIHWSNDLFQIHRVRVRGTTTPEILLQLLETNY